MSESNNTFMEKLTDVAGRIGNVQFLQILKDAFQALIPLYVLAGLGTLLNSVIFPLFLSGESLTEVQRFGTIVNNATLNISGILIAIMIAYQVAKHLNFEDITSVVVVSVSSFIALLPLNPVIGVLGQEDVTVEALSAVTFTNLGVNGIFTGIIVGFLSSYLFIKFASIDRLKINLGDGVPSAVTNSFNALFPYIFTISTFAIVSTILNVVWDTNVFALITTLIQTPLQTVGTSLGGMILLYTLGTALFSLGIHHGVITNSILQPLLLINMSANIEAAAAGEAAPYILNDVFRIVFAQMGGHGVSIALIIAILISSKYEPYRNIVKVGGVPAIFNINEPFIFGLPIVYNIPLMIPFILAPIVGILIGYVATYIGFIEPLTVYIPWTTPPLVSGFLASGGDIKVSLVQLIIIVVNVLLYIPAIKISERVAIQQAESEM